MSAYSDPFNTQQTSPISRALRSILLRNDVSLNWPENYGGQDYIAAINEVTPSQSGWSVTLPSALQANVGTSFIFVNLGSFSFSIKDHTNSVVTSLNAGEMKYFYCSDNTSEEGAWRVTGLGSTTHAADAIALAGSGTKAAGGKLAVAYPVTTVSGDLTLTGDDRAKVIVANAGSVNITLPAYTVGNDFFVTVKNSGSGSVTITAPAGTVDGQPTLVLSPNESSAIHCSGTASWYTVGLGRSTEFQFTKLVKDVTAGGVITLTSAEASNKLMQFIGSPTADVTVVVPSVVGIYYVQNSYSSPNSLTIKTSAGAGIAMSSSDRAILYCDGVNVTSAQSVAVGTNISVVDGSLVSPAINFASDTNTGIYRADADTVGFVSNGQDALLVSSSKIYAKGNVGIGTTTPSGKLHINAGSNIEAIHIQGSGSSIQYWGTANITRYAQTIGDSVTVNGVSIPGLRDYVELINGERAFYINNNRRVAINDSGQTVLGNIYLSGDVLNLSSQKIFPGFGANTFTGVQQLPSARCKSVSLGVLTGGTQNLDLASASTYSCTVTGVVNFTFSNKPPAGYDQTTYLKITNGKTYPPNWPSGTRFPKGVKPALTAGIDLVGIWYDVELQAHVVGLIWEDYK